MAKVLCWLSWALLGRPVIIIAFGCPHEAQCGLVHTRVQPISCFKQWLNVLDLISLFKQDGITYAHFHALSYISCLQRQSTKKSFLSRFLSLLYFSLSHNSPFISIRIIIKISCENFVEQDRSQKWRQECNSRPYIPFNFLF